MPRTIDEATKIAGDIFTLGERTADKAIEKQSELGGLAAMFLARAASSLTASTLLARAGLNGDAMAVARTAVELDIDFAYIAKDPKPRMKKFTDYDDQTQYRLAEAIADLHGGNVDQTAMQKLKERHDHAKASNPTSKMNWAGKPIKKRAKATGRKRHYSLVYSDMCEASHSCYGTLRYVLRGSPDGPSLSFKPAAPDDKAVMLACVSVLSMISTVVEALTLEGLQDEIDRLTEIIVPGSLAKAKAARAAGEG